MDTPSAILASAEATLGRPRRAITGFLDQQRRSWRGRSCGCDLPAGTEPPTGASLVSHRASDSLDRGRDRYHGGTIPGHNAVPILAGIAAWRSFARIFGELTDLLTSVDGARNLPLLPHGSNCTMRRHRAVATVTGFGGRWDSAREARKTGASCDTETFPRAPTQSASRW